MHLTWGLCGDRLCHGDCTTAAAAGCCWHQGWNPPAPTPTPARCSVVKHLARGWSCALLITHEGDVQAAAAASALAAEPADGDESSGSSGGPSGWQRLPLPLPQQLLGAPQQQLDAAQRVTQVAAGG